MISLSDLHNWGMTKGINIVDFAFKLLLALILYLIIRKVLTVVLNRLAKRLEKLKIDPSVSGFILSLTRYGVEILVIVTIIIQLNIVQATSIAALIASAGVAVSLALQGGLSNFAGGLMLLFLKPFRVGDYIIVKAADVEGNVTKLELYYTTIHTLDNQMIMVPNSTLTGNTIINVTAMSNRMLELKIGISYDSDIRKAKQILEEILDEDPQTQEDNRIIFVDELGDSAVVLGIRVWVKTDAYWKTKWRLNESIKLAFDEKGISIPFPQMDVHLIDQNGTAKDEGK